MAIQAPYLVYLGDIKDDLSAKTGRGIADWRPDRCVGEVRLADCEVTVGLKEMTIAEGVAAGAKTLVLGGANAGGKLSSTWIASIVEALEAGLDVASGLHEQLRKHPEIAPLAEKLGRQLTDARYPDVTLDVGKGFPRKGKRLLAVGTDCSVGKMYTTLAIDKEMQTRGMNSTFRATGQTGILITGEGISVDAVISDFIAGAAEYLSPEADSDDHWDIVEGQGSLFHPSFAGVTMGLIHGSQPDALVLCHEPTRTSMRGVPGRALPSLEACRDMNLAAAQLTNPDTKFVGVAINTSGMSVEDGKAYCAEVEAQLGLPTVDPVRDGVGRIVDNL